MYPDNECILHLLFSWEFINFTKIIIHIVMINDEDFLADEKYVLAENYAVGIISLVRYLREVRKERIISDQICRSATSIGANIAESKFAESTSDFIHKLAISQKETNETLFWLRILYRTGYVERTWFEALYTEGKHILRILSRIIISLKNGKG